MNYGKRLLHLSVLVLLLLPTALLSQSLSPSLEVEYLKKIVYTLAADSMQGRVPNTKGDTMAREYIQKQFEEIGLLPFTKDSFSQNFSYSLGNQLIHTQNILATSHHSTKNILCITAHYDHIPPNSHLSKDFKKKNAIHNGADDNASGVAVMLLLAQKLQISPENLPFQPVFIAFSGHEEGLFGSQYFVSNLKKEELQRIKWVINLDMLGRINQNDFTLNFRIPPQNPAESLSAEILEYEKIKCRFLPFDAPADHSVFHEKGIFCGTFSTGIHRDYHKSTDDANTLDYESMAKITELIYIFTEKYIGRF